MRKDKGIGSAAHCRTTRDAKSTSHTLQAHLLLLLQQGALLQLLQLRRRLGSLLPRCRHRLALLH